MMSNTGKFSKTKTGITILLSEHPPACLCRVIAWEVEEDNDTRRVREQLASDPLLDFSSRDSYTHTPVVSIAVNNR